MADSAYVYNNQMWSFDASKYPVTPTGISAVKIDISFIVYPNPTASDKSFCISTSEKGEIIFYDELGQVISDTVLSKGINHVILNTQNRVVLYKFTTTDNQYKDGKIIIYG
jgi:hypothetical protein